MGRVPSQTKAVFRPTRSHTHGVAVGYYPPPRWSGAQNHDHLDAALNGFVGASGCSPFFPAFVAPRPIRYTGSRK